MTADNDFILKNHKASGDSPQPDSGTGETDKKGDKAGSGGAPLPAIDFSTFIMSLNASALVNLGVIDDPVTGEKAKNLPLGKQTIDIIGMLEEKTKGNLTADEAKLLQGMLYDLRIAYVRESS